MILPAASRMPRMLAKQGIITEQEAETIIEGLNGIGEEITQGKFQFKPELEDIHMNIESRLIEKIGDVGKKLHTARSRNDQVALDITALHQGCDTAHHRPYYRAAEHASGTGLGP